MSVDQAATNQCPPSSVGAKPDALHLQPRGKNSKPESHSSKSSSSFCFSEVKGDLFSCPDSSSLAHCVSEDMAMGKGVAVLFKRKFAGVAELKAQGM